jgi:hypothetical protein
MQFRPRSTSVTPAFAKSRLDHMHSALLSHVESGVLPGIVALVRRRGTEHVETIGNMTFGRIPLRCGGIQSSDLPR